MWIKSIKGYIEIVFKFPIGNECFWKCIIVSSLYNASLKLNVLLEFINQAMNIPEILPSSSIKIWGKRGLLVIIAHTNRQIEITTLYILKPLKGFRWSIVAVHQRLSTYVFYKKIIRLYIVLCFQKKEITCCKDLCFRFCRLVFCGRLVVCSERMYVKRIKFCVLKAYVL